MNRSKSERGIFFMIISSSFISILGLSTKFGLQEISPMKISFYRYAAPLFLMLPYLWITKELKVIRLTANLSTHLLRSFSAATAQFTMSYYLTRASLLDASMLWCTGPLFIPIILRVFYQKKVEPATWISVVLSFLGVALIIKPEKGLFDPFTLWGIASGVAMGFSQVFWGINAEKGSLWENLFFLFLYGALWLILPAYFFDPTRLAVPLDTVGIVTLMGLTIAAIGNQFFRSKAYALVRPYLLTPFLYFSVILSGIIDWLLYGHKIDFIAILGLVFVMIGIFVKWRYLRYKAL